MQGCPCDPGIMADAHDPFWQAAADHIRALGLNPKTVLAPKGFEAVLPACALSSLAGEPGTGEVSALVLHKGRLEEVPGDVLVSALDELTPTFANEVFVALTCVGTDLGADNPHYPGRDALLTGALKAQARSEPEDERRARMPANYVGAGRVLLETAFGHLMLVDGADTSITPHLIRDGWFDRNLTDLIRGILKPGMTYIDVGANFGTYALIGADAVGAQGRALAIEPVPAIAALLVENITMNGFDRRAKVIDCAVGKEPGSLTLYEFATRRGSNSAIPEIAQAAEALYGETITKREVECRTLDTIVEEQNFTQIDLMKIDVEGFEYEALLGGKEAILKHRPRLILEWLSGAFETRPEVMQKLWALLVDELGYRLHRVEQGATTRPIEFAELSAYGHSDLLGEPD